MYFNIPKTNGIGAIQVANATIMYKTNPIKSSRNIINQLAIISAPKQVPKPIKNVITE